MRLAAEYAAMTMMGIVGFKFKRQKAYEDYLFKKDNQHRD